MKKRGIQVFIVMAMLLLLVLQVSSFVSASVVATSTTNTYNVSGKTLEEVWNSIQTNSPNPGGAAGYVKWEVGAFRTDGEPEVVPSMDHSCPGNVRYTASITRTITWSIKITITLPKWTDGYSNACAEVKAEWDRYLAALTDYEKGYAKAAEDDLTNANPLPTIIGTGSDCDQDTAIDNAQADLDAKYSAEGQRVLSEVQASTDKYDADTQGAVLDVSIGCAGIKIDKKKLETGAHVMDGFCKVGALGAVGTSVIKGVILLLVPEPTGVTKVLGVVEIGYGVVAALSGLTAWLFKDQAAKDPPYTEVFQIRPRTLGPWFPEPTTNLEFAAIDCINSSLRVIETNEALAFSFERQRDAYSNGDLDYYRLQIRAVLNYTNMLISDLTGLASSSAKFNEELVKWMAERGITLTPEDFTSYQQKIATEGFSAEELQIYKEGLLATDEQIEQIKNQILSIDPVAQWGEIQSALPGLHDVILSTLPTFTDLASEAERILSVMEEMLTPTVTGVSPDSGKQGETLVVTITGTNFTGATGVSFGAGITVNSFNVDSSTQITANITIDDSRPIGTTVVSVLTPTGTVSRTDGFTVEKKVCFIATAAYGTPMAEEIQILREFRDQYLLTNPVGEALVDLYYHVSPPMAEFITEHPALKPVVRAGLVPVVAMSTVAVNTTLAEKIAIVGSMALVSGLLVIWLRKRAGKARGRAN